MTTRCDNELVSGFRAGDVSCFEELMNRYHAKAFGLASRLTKNQEDAEEVLQDVFVTVFRKLEGFEGKSAFSSWLYRITVNAALMKLRKKRRDESLAIEDVPEAKNVPSCPEGSDQAEKITLRAEVRHALESAVARLADEYRVVFVLRDIEGIPTGEVARMLDLTVPAVKSRLHRARLMLRGDLAQYVDHIEEYQSAAVSNF
jgi:RNA polymerase sigma-70 factor, ECF subfamily